MLLHSYYSAFFLYLYFAYEIWINADIIKLALIGIIAVSAGSLLGASLFKKIDRELLKKAIYLVLIITGLATLL